MPREYKLYLQDILEAIEKIQSYVGVASAQDVLNNSMLRDAVLHNLMIIGEAAKRIPEEVRAEYPHVEWRNIARFRDFVVHQYFGLDESIVEDVIHRRISELRTAIEATLERESP